MKICDLGRGMAEKERRGRRKEGDMFTKWGGGKNMREREREKEQASFWVSVCISAVIRSSLGRGRDAKKILMLLIFTCWGKEFLVHLSDRANAAFKIPKNQEFETKISVQTEIAGKFRNIQ